MAFTWLSGLGARGRRGDRCFHSDRSNYGSSLEIGCFAAPVPPVPAAGAWRRLIPSPAVSTFLFRISLRCGETGRTRETNAQFAPIFAVPPASDTRDKVGQPTRPKHTRGQVRVRQIGVGARNP